MPSNLTSDEVLALISTRMLLSAGQRVMVDAPGSDPNPFDGVGPIPDGPLLSTHRTLPVAPPEEANRMIEAIDRALAEGTIGVAGPILRALRLALGTML